VLLLLLLPLAPVLLLSQLLPLLLGLLSWTRWYVLLRRRRLQLGLRTVVRWSILLSL
jgi:hypothetical protein